MAESKIRDDNYYQISGWMINRLGLKGAKLNVFAIIYGFSQDGESEFTGSRQYLSDFINASKPTVDKALSELCDDEYLIKTSKIINNVTFNTYKANIPVVKNLCGGSKETLPPSKETCIGGSKETLPNNKSLNNKNNNKDNSKERKTVASNSFDILIEKYLSDDGKNYNYADSDERRELLQEWLKVRKAKRAAMTDRAIELNLNKLNKLASKSNMSVVEYLKEVICRGWQAFFEIKDYNNQQEKTENNFTYQGKRLSDLTQAEYEEYLKTQKNNTQKASMHNWLESGNSFIKNNYTQEQINGCISNLDEVDV